MTRMFEGRQDQFSPLTLFLMANATTTSPTASSSTPSSSSSSSSIRPVATAANCPERRRKMPTPDSGELLPGLPDHIAQLCLSKVHPSFLHSVCRSWRRLIYSPSFPPFLSLYAVLTSSPAPASFTIGPSKIEFSAYDPVASKWRPLPPPLSDEPLTILRHHPSFLSRDFPIQSVAVSGNLVLLAGTANNFFPAVTQPLIFNPISGRWSTGPPPTVPRRWCAAGASGSAVYVASGIGAQFNTEVAKSVEKWDLNCTRGCSYWEWQKLGDLKDGKFSRDAIDAVGLRGKLCMVNVKGGSAREGGVYDIQTDTWQDMPKGMVGGWNGPAAAMDEETLYMVDITGGILRRYDVDEDSWDDVMVSYNLKGAQQIAAAGGRVCVICDRGESIAVVDIKEAPPRMWVVNTPEGSQAVAVHILPRMSNFT